MLWNLKIFLGSIQQDSYFSEKNIHKEGNGFGNLSLEVSTKLKNADGLDVYRAVGKKK